LFLDDYFVFRVDRVFADSNVTRGGCVLTAIYRYFSDCKRRYDFGLVDGCVCKEVLMVSTHVLENTTFLLILKLLRTVLILWELIKTHKIPVHFYYWILMFRSTKGLMALPKLTHITEVL
jgi:hypothetical protein